MKKVFFTFIILLLMASIPSAVSAKPINRFFANSKIDTNTLQSKCSNTCLSNYTDILRCSSAKIILDDILQNELIDDKNKK